MGGLWAYLGIQIKNLFKRSQKSEATVKNKACYRSMGTTGDPDRFTGWSVQQMTSMQKPQNEECWTLSPNPTNTHSAEHELLK